ncbi:MAG: DUF4838 domain-containing protein [Phycisphaeraceae bacterium]|nr:DUF4838 domain-containing protein [Phycisphaeraceae bacterium]
MTAILLIEGNVPRAQLVLNPHAAPAEMFAARELQTHLERVGGTRLPEVVPDARKPDAYPVYVGRSTAADRLVGDFDWSSLKEDGVLIHADERGLVLSGNSPRGTLYAVYEYLERELGCRWLTPHADLIPRRESIALRPLRHVYVPPFRYREPYFLHQRDPDWSSRSRINCSMYELDDAHGGRMAYAGFVHTFYPLLPPDEFFETHPEYFSEVDGQRIRDQGQLCLTNPDVVDLLSQRLRKLLLANPETRIASVSQNDWYGYCRCVNCAAVDAREGSASGTMVSFVNAVAERLEGEFPHVLFDTLAYTYTLKAPRHVRPRHNVVIRLCHITPCCDGHPLDRCAINTPFLDHLTAWGAISHELFIWDYFTNFWYYFMPFPNIDALGADLARFADAGVTGMFCQMDGNPPKGCGELGELKAYLFTKLLWNPRQDVWRLVDEFLTGYYGSAAPLIREYLDMMHAIAKRPDVHFSLYSPPMNLAFLEDGVIEKAAEIFDRAAAAVRGDEVMEDRVAAARLSIDYMRWKPRLGYARDGNRYLPSNAQTAGIAKRFFEVAIKHGAQALREGGRPISEEAHNLKGFDAVVLKAQGIEAVIVPKLGARITSLTTGGAEWLHIAHPTEQDYPFAGGYEEYSQSRWRSPGWGETYTANAQEDSAVFTATLENGLTMQRQCAIEPWTTGPSLVIRTTLTNHSAKTVTTMIRPHPEFDPGDLCTSSIRIRQADGSWRDWSEWREANRSTGDVWLHGVDAPQGAWAIRRSNDELIVEFNASDLSHALLSWDGPQRIARLELFSRLIDLSPEQSRTFEQRWIPGKTNLRRS